MQKITPFLWFDDNAEEAMNFYVSIFKDARIVSTMPGPDGKLMGGTFVLNDQEFMVLNGGPMYTFTPAISLFVKCETQEEVDYYWENLTKGGSEKPCGWLKDKFGLSHRQPHATPAAAQNQSPQAQRQADRRQCWPAQPETHYG